MLRPRGATAETFEDRLYLIEFLDARTVAVEDQRIKLGDDGSLNSKVRVFGLISFGDLGLFLNPYFY